MLATTTLPAALRGPAVSLRRQSRSTRPNVTAMAGHGRFFVGGAFLCSIHDRMLVIRPVWPHEHPRHPVLVI